MGHQRAKPPLTSTLSPCAGERCSFGAAATVALPNLTRRVPRPPWERGDLEGFAGDPGFPAYAAQAKACGYNKNNLEKSDLRRSWKNYAEKSPRPPASSWPWKGCTAGSASCPPGKTPSGRWPPGISGSLRTAPSRSGAWPAAGGTRRLSCAGPRRPVAKTGRGRDARGTRWP